MARLRLDISEDCYLQLLKIAVQERRPCDWQAEVLLERAIAEYAVPMLRPDAPDVERVLVQDKA
jgi:hypothetical protein